MKIIIIAALAPNRVIGKDGRIPWHDPEDLRHFKQTTTGHAVIMGRRTFESIGRPLPNRRNVVITRDRGYAHQSREQGRAVRPLEQSRDREGAVTPSFGKPADLRGPPSLTAGALIEHSRDREGGVLERTRLTTLDIAHSLDEALDLCRRRNEEKTFIIGGAQIYAQALPIADEMILTRIDCDDIPGDAFFPKWDPAQWAAQPQLPGALHRVTVFCRTK